MRKSLFIFALIPLLLCSCTSEREYSKTIYEMDTVMDLKIYSSSDSPLSEAESEIRRIASIIDRGREGSEIFNLNKNKSASLSEETARLLEKSISLSERSGGTFDITIAPVMDLWGFYGENFHVPSDAELNEALKNVGYDKIKLDGNKAALSDGASVDLGGIGKGYASDCVTDVLKNAGVSSAIISLGGNVQAVGKRPNGEDWVVGITDPFDKTSLIGSLKIHDKAVITSGGYQRFFEDGNNTYHHILDPSTGKNPDSDLSSVTIVSESGTTADALSTALFVKGLDESISFWKDSDDFGAIFVTDKGEIYVTENIASDFSSDREFNIVQ
jgi:thiamine biosynthesis lipoprotein